MNRSSRVHKSTKIPNVKLRPAPAASTSAAVERDNARRQTEREDNEHYRKIRRAAAADADRRAGGESALVVRDSLEPESCRSVGQEDHEDKDDEDAEAEFALPEVMPLAGINVCFSSIADEDDRLKLTRLATRLGARVESDLREDVNYLICEKVGSPKYQQALERGKFIVQPGWLEEVHRRYQDDLPFEWVKMYSAHRVKALQGCHILFTGYKKDKSLAIEKAQGLGARVSHEITGDNGVTHVVSGTNSNAESKLVETLASFWDGYDKGTLRTERMIRIVETVKPVWSEWLEDCERAGGALREDRYSLWREKPNINQRTQIVQRIREHHHASSTLHPVSVLHQRATFISSQRNGSQAAANPLGARRAPALASLIQQSRADTSSGLRRAVSEGMRMGIPGESVVLSQSRRDRFSEPAAADQLGAPSSQQAGKRKASEADIAAQAESHPSKVPRAASVDRRHNPFAKVVDRPVARSPFAMLDDIVPVRRRFGSPLNRSEHEEPESKKGIFFKCRFRIKLPEEAHIRSTRAYLEEQGAIVLSASDIATKADYTVVPIFYPYGAESIEGHLVTKLFIERCVWEERVVRLTASFGLQPSPYAAPITGGTDLVVYLTGFRKDGIDQKQAETVIKEAGGRTLSALLRRECTHLLCSEQVASGAKGSDKVDVARAAGIHIVGMDFIQRLMDRGLIDPPCPRSRSMSVQGRSTSFGMSDSSILGPTQIETEPRLDGRKSNAESPLRQKAGSESPAKPEFPLKGVYLAWSSVVYPDKGFLSQAKDLGAVIVSLGDGMTTHLLHRGALTQGCAAGVVSPEVRTVDPDWLRACLATKSHAREDLYPVDLGRSAPLAESTPRVTAVRTAPMFEAAKQQSDALASNQPGSGDEASPPSLVVLKASSSGTTEASSDADNQAYVFALPDTCGETARVMAALNTGMETALGGHAPAAAAVPAGRRKLRPQRALGRTGSNGSATETKPAAQEDAARAGASADRSYDAAWPGGISQVNLTSETPPISVRVSYEDDGKKERARLLAAMERDRKRKQREEADSHRDEDDEALSSTKEFPARSPMDGSRSTGKGASSSSSSKNRIQARKQPGSRH
ncbi:unnamed protein product [Tilletia laevis]|uniref:BRCT domain-containing protein n=2 Tax=Tilletia TaxID=13289 RepID=A0A177VF50_9BASI|nr:hypothetical protein CF336_g4178 [Tilletia laevis]KAE8261133.1 hypothetical protein A4X03_0g3517 [Tilletia caries]KAE8202635.1 hypothetical protein CF335_g3340 [Tilletia laevis]CAD6886502.1 unnamed protein product [Tilletia caries]CAD6946913.1 unnamed protein product [Tilletia caries]